MLEWLGLLLPNAREGLPNVSASTWNVNEGWIENTFHLGVLVELGYGFNARIAAAHSLS